MTDAQLVVATGLPLFMILTFAAVYMLEYVLDRLEQILGRPLDKIEQRLSTIDASLSESNRHRQTLVARIDRLAERR